jgi:NAD(P)-dependent dehydrogenase (short-subunit alcohol dehydrogenase family)
MLTDKTVLVTGASRGIGAAIVSAVGAAGAYVICHYGSHVEGAEAAVADIPEERRLLLPMDLSVPGSARRLWADAVAWRGRVDVIVLNAAVNIETPFEGSDAEWDAGWDTTMQVNVLEPASLVKEGLGHFVENGGGVFIGLSSWSAQRGSAIASLPAYAASKAAVKSLMQTVARNYGPQGVLAYVLAPGIVKTRMADLAAATRGGEEAVRAGLVLNELVPPEELGDLVTFLATGRMKHLTGATLDVNGASYIR